MPAFSVREDLGITSNLFGNAYVGECKSEVETVAGGGVFSEALRSSNKRKKTRNRQESFPHNSWRILGKKAVGEDGSRAVEEAWRRCARQGMKHEKQTG